MTDFVEITSTAISSIEGDQLFLAGVEIGELVASRSFADLIEILWKKKLHDLEALHESIQMCELSGGESSDELPSEALDDESSRGAQPSTNGARPPFEALLYSALALRERRQPADHHWALAYELLTLWTYERQIGDRGARSEFRFSTSLLRRTGAPRIVVESADACQLFDQVMMVHSENELNFSTLALRLGAASGSDFLSSVVAALEVLRGHKHGGASYEVMKFFEECSNQSPTEAVDLALQNKQKVPGFGHLIFRGGDPRAPLLKRLLENCLQTNSFLSSSIYDRAISVEAQMMKRKGLRANVDFYAAVIYQTLGIDKSWATALFAISRLMGWAAHYEEERRRATMKVARSRLT